MTEPLPQPLHLPTVLNSFAWGRARPRGHQGRLLMALALWQWSEGQLVVYSYDPQTQTPPYYYAATLHGRQEASIINIDGWHIKPSQSRTAREKDGGMFGSYSYGRVLNPAQLMAEQPAGLQKKIHALTDTLRTQLGPLDWAQWQNVWSLLTARDSPPSSLSNPIHIQGQWLVPFDIPLRQHSDRWPPGMSPEELTTWLSCITKEQIGWTYYFFDFQDHLVHYLEKNPQCVWTPHHAETLIKNLKEICYPVGKKGSLSFFDTYDDEHWPIKTTCAVHPSLRPFLPELLRNQATGSGSPDYHWLRATYFPDPGDYTMLATTFQGKSTLSEHDTLTYDGIHFRLRAQQGQPGVITTWEPHGQSESQQLDALRQIRAYCGGAVGLSDNVLASNPSFWQARFERKEIAQCGNATHWHWRAPPYEGPPLEPSPLVPAYDARARMAVEHSLFQRGSPLHFDVSIQDALEQPWGWKIYLQHPEVSLAPENATDWERRYAASYLWSQWSKNMTPLEAFTVATQMGSYLETSDLHESLAKLLPATQLAVCEIGGFSHEVMMAALHAYGLQQAGLENNTAVELPDLQP